MTTLNPTVTIGGVQIPEKVLAAIRTVQREAKDGYAQTYAQDVVFQEAAEVYGERGVKVQILYVLNNLGTWQGETARETKRILKEYAEAKS